MRHLSELLEHFLGNPDSIAPTSISAKAQDDCTWGVVMLPQQEEDVALVESRTARPEAEAEQGFSQRAAELHVAGSLLPHALLLPRA